MPKRVSIQLPDDLSTWLEQSARARGATPSALVLEILRQNAGIGQTSLLFSPENRPLPPLSPPADIVETSGESSAAAPAQLLPAVHTAHPPSDGGAAAGKPPASTAPRPETRTPSVAATARPAAFRIYSDGACSGNPGPGGYGVIVDGPDGRTEHSDGFAGTTNNRMELLGAIVGIESIPQGSQATVVSDSTYVVDAIMKRWIQGWKARGWRKASGEPVKNIDLWKRLLAAMEGRQVRFEWVRGHVGHPENERCDRLAVAAAQRRDLPRDTGAGA